jgi:hypothetical protein
VLVHSIGAEWWQTTCGLVDRYIRWYEWDVKELGVISNRWLQLFYEEKGKSLGGT